MGIGIGDYDNDGREDLFVVNFSRQMKSVYHNLGNGVFENVSYQAGMGGINLDYLGFPMECFDYDLDGHKDLIYGNGHIRQIAASEEGIVIRAEGAKQLLHNQHNGTFKEDFRSLGDLIQSAVMARGMAIGDYRQRRRYRRRYAVANRAAHGSSATTEVMPIPLDYPYATGRHMQPRCHWGQELRSTPKHGIQSAECAQWVELLLATATAGSRSVWRTWRLWIEWRFAGPEGIGKPMAPLASADSTGFSKADPPCQIRASGRNEQYRSRCSGTGDRRTRCLTGASVQNIRNLRLGLLR